LKHPETQTRSHRCHSRTVHLSKNAWRRRGCSANAPIFRKDPPAWDISRFVFPRCAVGAQWPASRGAIHTQSCALPSDLPGSPRARGELSARPPYNRRRQFHHFHCRISRDAALDLVGAFVAAAVFQVPLSDISLMRMLVNLSGNR